MLAKINFGPSQESGHEELAGASPAAHNVTVDGKGAVRRRPALAVSRSWTQEQVDPDGIEALHFTDDGKLWGVSGWKPQRNLYEIGATSFTNRSTSYAEQVRGESRPLVAHNESLIIVTAGQEPQKWERLSETSARLGGSPPKATHVIFNATRALLNIAVEDPANGNKTQFQCSAPGTGSTTITPFEIWNNVPTSQVFSAESRPDPIVALGENTNEVFVWGSGSLQIYVPDPNSVYSPVPTREHGTLAPYSIVKMDQAFAWLDDKKRFVLSDGRQLQVISNGIQETINAMSKTSDCFGYRYQRGPVDALVWAFPSDGRTFAFQLNGGWSQWTGMSPTNWDEFPVTAHAYRDGANVVGTSDGYIRELDPTVTTDYDTSSKPIRASVSTGFIDRGTDARKQCVAVRLTLRRGVNDSAETERVGFLQWRDQLGEYSPPHWFDLGERGDTEVVVQFRSLGVYRRRQWKIEFSGAADWTLVDVKEEYQILGD